MSRLDVVLLALVLAVVLFLFWSRNVVVRMPGVSSPMWSGIRSQRSDVGRVAACGCWSGDGGYGIVLPRVGSDVG